MATVEGDQPRVRPFGTAHIFEGKLYIQTGKTKDVSKQIHANPFLLSDGRTPSPMCPPFNNNASFK